MQQLSQLLQMLLKQNLLNKHIGFEKSLENFQVFSLHFFVHFDFEDNGGGAGS